MTTVDERLAPVLAAVEQLETNVARRTRIENRKQRSVMYALMTDQVQDDRAAVRDAIVALVVGELESVAVGVAQCHRSQTIDQRLAEWRAAREG